MPERSRRSTDRARRAGVLACLVAVTLAGCGAPAGTGTAVPEPTMPAPGVLPDVGAFLPAAVAGGTVWSPLSSLPNEFDISERFQSPDALAAAYLAELEAGWAGGPRRPTFGVGTFSEADASSVKVVTELGPGDDSVAGAQYALVIGRHADGWTLDGLWGRALCHRGVDPAGQLCV